jgi:YVTN family beta-propeller protein
MKPVVPHSILNICIIGITFFVTGSAIAQIQGPYQVLKQWKIEGDGRWDYLEFDPLANVLYVTHGTSVAVLDGTSGTAIAMIAGVKNAHGIALDDAGRFGYISDGLSNDVVVFDRHTYNPILTVPTGENPDGIAFEPLTKTVWIFNGTSRNASILDAASNKIIATIAVPGKPEFAIADGRGSIYDNLEDKGEIARFDAKSRKLSAIWKLTGCDAPTGMAMDKLGHRLFSVCDNNRMAAVNADTGVVLGLASIGDSPDAARFSSKLNLVFSSNGGGSLTVIDVARKYSVLQTLRLPKGAATLAYDDATDRVFLSVADYGTAPETTTKVRHPLAPMLPESFHVIVVGRK